jgi:hypothetical protein
MFEVTNEMTHCVQALIFDASSAESRTFGGSFRRRSKLPNSTERHVMTKKQSIRSCGTAGLAVFSILVLRVFVLRVFVLLFFVIQVLRVQSPNSQRIRPGADI